METLIYMEEAPEKAVLIDSLPRSVQIDNSGAIAGGSFVSAIPSLIIPTISILGHGWYFMNVFLY